MEIVIKAGFGWGKDKARPLFIIIQEAGMKAIGRAIKRKVKVFCLRMTKRLKFLIADIFIFHK